MADSKAEPAVGSLFEVWKLRERFSGPENRLRSFFLVLSTTSYTNSCHKLGTVKSILSF